MADNIMMSEEEFAGILDRFVRNEISVSAREAEEDGALCRSKFGGVPAVPEGFVWPRYEAANFDEVVENRPLSFLCQIDLAEVKPFDHEDLLPEKGLLLFFYEQESQKWGFDPEDRGCARVFYFEDPKVLRAAELSEDMEEFLVREYDLDFAAKESYPSYEELDCYMAEDVDWEAYDEAVEERGYSLEAERHKLLGYADLIQNEMLTECERVTRGLYCGDSESYRNTPQEVKAEIDRAAADWVLLFQMASIMDGDYELMFGDMGNLYFYIRREDLKARRFDRVWLVLQCG